MKTFIIVKNQYEGVHRYENAPEEVIFLRDYHRHLFTIKSKIQVFHEDRELEFIMVKHLIDDFLNEKMYLQNSSYWFMENLSCEQVAIQIYQLLREKYGKKRKISIEVSEDDENSAIIEE